MSARHLFTLLCLCTLSLALAVAQQTDSALAQSELPNTQQHDRHTVRPQHRAGALKLGTVHFPNTGAADAQGPFLRGVALLHSFEYLNASIAFREAQRADPNFALAYWGEALTYSQFLWGVEDLQAARAALRRLASTREARLSKAGNARERAFGNAVEAFLAEGEPVERARAYAETLRQYATARPTDLEGLALLRTGQWCAPRPLRRTRRPSG